MLLVVATSTRAAVVLQYHHVSEETPASTSVTPAQFDTHLQRLAEQGFEVVRLDTLVERVRNGLDPRRKVAAITFDDASSTLMADAIPALEARGWTAAIFVNTAGVAQGWDDVLTAEQLRGLHDKGHLIANHTVSHPHMVRRNDGESETQWLERMRGEVVQAQDRLTEWLGEEPPRYLAWPFGEQVPALREMVAELGFVAFGQQTGALGGYTDWQQAPRIPINRRYGDWRSLSDKVNALPFPVVEEHPATGVTGRETPELRLRLAGDWHGRVSCFARGEPAKVSMRSFDEGTEITVVAKSPLPTGRHRYNCTAGAGDGRFHWYSRLWMRKPEQGWYPEYGG